MASAELQVVAVQGIRIRKRFRLDALERGALRPHVRSGSVVAFMNKLINSPQNLGKTEPLAYIEATVRAGYEGVGIRTYRSPGGSYNFNPIVGNRDLERDVKHALDDSALEVYDLYSFYLQPEMDWNTIKPALEFGGEIGCKFVLVIGDDPEWSRMVETRGELIDFIEPMGMKASIEAFATALTPMATCLKFVADCKPKYVGMWQLSPRTASRVACTVRRPASAGRVRRVSAFWLQRPRTSSRVGTPRRACARSPLRLASRCRLLSWSLAQNRGC